MKWSKPAAEQHRLDDVVETEPGGGSGEVGVVVVVVEGETGRLPAARGQLLFANGGYHTVSPRCTSGVGAKRNRRGRELIHLDQLAKRLARLDVLKQAP